MDPADEALAAGYEPAEPYPGATERLWLVHCTTCRLPIEVRLRDIRWGRRCRRCHPPPRRRVSDDEALEVLAELHLEPLEPFPGAVAQPWRVRCQVCGAESSPRVSNLRRKPVVGCSHCPHPRAPRRR